MSHLVDWPKAPADATFYSGNHFCRVVDAEVQYLSDFGWRYSDKTYGACQSMQDFEKRPQANDASVSIANLLNAQVSIANARKSSEFSEQNSELADQADAILQAIIGNLKAERIPAEASFHLANAQNELNACAKLLEGDKTLADAVFCIGEKLAGIRKGEL